MLFSKDFLFVHVPKTGGMSVTRWLLNNYLGEMYLCVPGNARAHAIATFAYPDIKPRVRILPGKRHETLSEARAVVRKFGMDLPDFRTIVAVARHPLDLERSYQAHLRKPSVARLRKNPDSTELRMAIELDITRFIERATFYGQHPARIEEYFEIDGYSPPNLKIVRMETLEADLYRIFSDYFAVRQPLQHRNRSSLPSQPDALSHGAVRAALLRKQPFLSRLYGITE